jgi:hypothetical protein
MPGAEFGKRARNMSFRVLNKSGGVKFYQQQAHILLTIKV